MPVVNSTLETPVLNSLAGAAIGGTSLAGLNLLAQVINKNSKKKFGKEEAEIDLLKALGYGIGGAAAGGTLGFVSSYPRSWELTPVTSILKNVVKDKLIDGEQIELGDAVRRGYNQSVGRYLTNLKEPFTYDFSHIKNVPIHEHLLNILEDKSEKTVSHMYPGDNYTDYKDFADARNRMTVFRENFELPHSLQTSEYLKKIGPGEFTYQKPEVIQAMRDAVKANPDLSPNAYYQLTDPSLLGRYLARRDGDKVRVTDIWDFASPEDYKQQNKNLLAAIRVWYNDNVMRRSKVHVEADAPTAEEILTDALNDKLDRD